MGVPQTNQSNMKLVIALACVAAVMALPQKPLSVNFVGMELANTTHYEDPKPNGCQSDEVSIQIQGIKGDFCAPGCSLFKPCPKDLPSGVTAKPQCVLQDASTKKKYCALICSPSTDEASLRAGDAACGQNASCKSIQGTGVCTYDD